MKDTTKKTLNKVSKLRDLRKEKQTEKLNKSTAKLKEIKSNNRGYKLQFPVDAFPPKMAAIIKTYHKFFGFPVDYYGTAFLSVAGAVLGNAFRAKYKHRFHTNALLYASIVGPSSMGKSIVMEEAVVPVYSIEDKYAAANMVLMENFKNSLSSWENTRERDSATKPTEPARSELFIDEITIESLYGSMRNNPKGLLYFKDELSAWVNGMGQYKGGKGTEGEFWLKNWSGARVKINRQGKLPVYINRPCISVLGALTPSFLTKLAEGGRGENGFLQRILFAYPDNMDKPKEPKDFPEPNFFEEFPAIVNQLNELPHNFNRNNQNPQEIEDSTGLEPIILQLDEGARKKFSAFLESNRQAINGTDDDMVKSVYGKMDSYCLRFSLIIELMGLACDLLDVVPDPNEPFDGATKGFLQTGAWNGYMIKEDSVDRAIQLSEYYKQTSFKVVRRFDSPVSRLNPKHRDFYKSLPNDEFPTKFAIELGEKSKIARASIERLLNNREIFRKKSRGLYEKMYL